MTIEQVVTLAKNSDLKTLAIKEDNETIVGFLNLGLIELYKRFPLKVSELVLELQDGKTLYQMPADYMWIVAAYAEVDEASTLPYKILPINDEDNIESVNTTSWNMLQIPLAATGYRISIMYTAAPEVCVYNAAGAVGQKYYYTTVDNGVSVKKYDIPIPAQMVEALLEYIAYKANSSYNADGTQDTVALYQRFEASCLRIEQRGMFNTDDLDMDARNMKGFV